MPSPLLGKRGVPLPPVTNGNYWMRPGQYVQDRWNTGVPNQLFPRVRDSESPFVRALYDIIDLPSNVMDAEWNATIRPLVTASANMAAQSPTYKKEVFDPWVNFTLPQALGIEDMGGAGGDVLNFYAKLASPSIQLAVGPLMAANAGFKGKYPEMVSEGLDPNKALTEGAGSSYSQLPQVMQDVAPFADLINLTTPLTSKTYLDKKQLIKNTPEIDKYKKEIDDLLTPTWRSEDKFFNENALQMLDDSIKELSNPTTSSHVQGLVDSVNSLGRIPRGTEPTPGGPGYPPVDNSFYNTDVARNLREAFGALGINGSSWPIEMLNNSSNILANNSLPPSDPGVFKNKVYGMPTGRSTDYQAVNNMGSPLTYAQQFPWENQNTLPSTSQPDSWAQRVRAGMGAPEVTSLPNIVPPPNISGIVGSGSSPSRPWDQTYQSPDQSNPWVNYTPPSMKWNGRLSTLPSTLSNIVSNIFGGGQSNGATPYIPTSSSSTSSYGSSPVPTPGGPGFGGYWPNPTGSATPTKPSITLPTADDPEQWYKNYLSIGGVGTRAEFDQVWSNPEQRTKFKADILAGMSGTTSGTTSGTGATSGTGSGTPSGTTGSNGYALGGKYAPTYAAYGIDPSWVNAYQQKHGGYDPISDYGKSGAYFRQGHEPYRERTTDETLFSAEWDKNWGDQFARTYGHAPSDADWADSFQHREDLKKRGVMPGA